ncbi:gastrula zinc finger protein XlCGF52.1 [Topomyia yanbarensis]|uniref:gastrula zinc finger protein XlCGF52.1 n=1 Tax=Topomyia yanbarensis TaxID=2498891 RepID=UPI00273CE7B0|nr:gastrula zinc finger protein XlCGF52.1 [Topomyia yanbarensis]
MTPPVLKECIVCHKQLKSRSSRLYHEHCQDPKLKPFKCIHCGRTFSSRSHKTFHEESHQGRRLSCDRCDKSYQHQRDLDLHLREHDRSKIHKCNMCLEHFNSQQALVKHRRSHGETKHFKCDQCDLTFSLKGNLVKHIKVLHSKEKRFSCGQCSKTFYRNNALTFHMLSHQARNFQCKTCEKEFVDARNLERHLKIHVSLKEFLCDVCGISSTRKDNIIRHVKSFHPEMNPGNVVLRDELGDRLDAIKKDAQQSNKSLLITEPKADRPVSNRVSVIQVVGVPKPLEITTSTTKSSITQKTDQYPKPATKLDPLEIYRKILKPSTEDDDDADNHKTLALTQANISTKTTGELLPPPATLTTTVSAANTNNSSSNNFVSINNFSEVHWRKRTSQIFTNSTR